MVNLKPSYDLRYLKLDGSNANVNIDIGAYDFTTTGTGNFGGLVVNGNLLFSKGAARQISIDSETEFDGRALTIIAGNTITGDGGDLTLQAGSGGGIGPTGGDVKIIGGAGWYGGEVFIDGDDGAGSNGNVLLQTVGSGNVGIGNGSPYSKLSVSGGDTDPSLTHGTTALVNIDNSLTDLAITIDTASPFAASIQHRHATLDDSSYPIALNPLGGNVGIGTVSPGTLLDVNGIATLGDASTLKTSAAPTADAEIANKKYVDDNAGGVYIRTATLIVAASDSADTTNADYFCDGTADEVQINAAIAALPATGGSVVLMDGTFDIDASILINKNDVSLIGQGKNTIIETDTAIRMLDTSTNSLRSLIRDIYFKGINSLNCYGIYLDGDYHNIIRCFFYNCFYNIYMLDNYNMIISCHFRLGEYAIYFAGASYNCAIGCYSFGVKYHNYFASASQYNKITGGNFHGGQYGVHFINGIKNTIVGCAAYQNSVAFAYIRANCHRNVVNGNVIYGGNYAVYIKGADFCTVDGNLCNNNYIGFYLEDSLGSNFNGNTFEDVSGTYGIHINTGGLHNITGNDFTKVDRHGIYIWAADHNIISSNNIHDCSEDANNTYSGIYLAGTATYNVINGNRISGDAANKHEYGIREAAAADDFNNVTGNTCTDAVTANISLQGLNDEEGHNIAP